MEIPLGPGSVLASVYANREIVFVADVLQESGWYNRARVHASGLRSIFALHRGTLFLDEVGDLPAAAPAKLLRALEGGQVQRVGGTQDIVVDVRLIAATNQDLMARVADKVFREDLYYRLNVFPIRLPPLRDRPGVPRHSSARSPPRWTPRSR